ncbi:MAG TPA: hypothetical protein VFL83_09345, partial [Anaeromyxobacter sp.]|nr:hypothetical protein [Anaeromyxobacter sp.]
MRSASDRLSWLQSQGLGLACGLSTVALLAIGSFVLAATRDGASAGIAMDDLRGFFDPPRLEHAWLYLLFPVAGLYAVNTALATWDTVVRRWRGGARAPSAYAASVVHVGFLLALAAHAAAGFRGEDRGEVLVSSGWQALPGFGEARLVGLDVDPLPGGMPRAVTARLEVRGPDGKVRPATVGYNAPLSGGAGARLALLGDFGRVRVARLASGPDACAIAEGQGCLIGGEAVRVVAIAPAPRGGAAALVRARGPSGVEETRWLGADGELALAGGRPLQLRSAGVEHGVLLRVREAPGNP